MTKVVMQTDIPGARLINRGKVRDIYDAGDNLLIVTTDRISAFDVIMNDGIPFKGRHPLSPKPVAGSQPLIPICTRRQVPDLATP